MSYERGDEAGLIWDTPVREGRGAPKIYRPSPMAFERLSNLPGKKWTCPELPTLRNRGIKQLCFDLETKDEDLKELGPGVRRPGNHIAGVGVGTDDGHRWYFPVGHAEGQNMDKKKVFDWCRDELNAFDGEVIGAHLLYDLDWSANEGVKFNNAKAFHDIQNAEPLLDEWQFSYSLETISHKYLNIGKDEVLLKQAATAWGFGQNETSIKTHLHLLPPEFVGAYVESDVDRPIHIWNEQRRLLEAEGLMRVYEVERKLIPLLLAMKRRGVRVNITRAKEISHSIGLRLVEMQAELRRLAGSDASFTSGQSIVKALLARGIKLQPTPSTKDKPPHQQTMSVTKFVLEAHNTDPLVALYLDGRKLTTLKNTFMEGHILGHHIDGRIHCSFNQLKSDEGGTIARFSSSDPNLQNVPARDEEMAPLIRSCFEPEPEEDWERLDESQVEYRLLVDCARGPGSDRARQMYNDNPETDFHAMTGDFLGVDAKDPFIRKRIKNTNFCKVYGGGPPKLAETARITVQEAIDFYRKYDAEFPFVKYTHEAAMKWATKRGFVETLLQRRQRFMLWEPRGNFDRRFQPLRFEEAKEKYGAGIVRAFIYAALNRKLQAGAADVMKYAMVQGWEAGIFDPTILGAPLLTVHDELDMSKPRNKKSEEAVVHMKYLMESGFKDQLRVPLICDRESGPNWGSLS